MSLRRPRLRARIAAILPALLALALALATPALAGATSAHHRHRHHHRSHAGCRRARRHHHHRRHCVSRARRPGAAATLRAHHTAIVIAVDRATPAAPSAPAPPAVPAVCPDAQLVPDSSNLDRVQAATMCLVNQQRVAAGEVALADDSRLHDAALEHSQDMVSRGYFAHVSPSGETPTDRVQASGYIPAGDGYEIGENLAGATGPEGTPAAIVSAWMQSPEHRANILNGDFRQSGISVVPAAPMSPTQAGATYTQEFGVLITG